MADKLLLVTMFIMLTLPGLRLANHVPLWLTVVIISRDVVIVLTVAIVNLAVGRRTFKPSFLGKAATAIYIATGVCAAWENYRGVESIILPWFVYASLAVTILSGIQYVIRMVAWLSAGAPVDAPRALR